MSHLTIHDIAIGVLLANFAIDKLPVVWKWIKDWRTKPKA